MPSVLFTKLENSYTDNPVTIANNTPNVIGWNKIHPTMTATNRIPVIVLCIRLFTIYLLLVLFFFSVFLIYIRFFGLFLFFFLFNLILLFYIFFIFQNFFRTRCPGTFAEYVFYIFCKNYFSFH